MSETVLDAQEVFAKPSGEGPVEKSSPEETPTEEEFQEAASPELSSDEFVLGDRTFKIRVSNIRTQKIMAKSLDAITNLISKIDLKPIVERFQEKINRDRKKIVDYMAGLEKNDDIDYEKAINKMASEDENVYIDMVELVQDIITHGGVSNIIETIIDLYTGIVFAICNSQDRDIKKKWVEENLTLSDAQEIFFKQMEKDRIGGKVIDFLYVATQQVIAG